MCIIHHFQFHHHHYLVSHHCYHLVCYYQTVYPSWRQLVLTLDVLLVSDETGKNFLLLHSVHYSAQYCNNQSSIICMMYTIVHNVVYCT